MEVVRQSILLDELLAGYSEVLGADYDAYRNHCLRIFNFCSALSRSSPDAEREDKIAVAAAFHDLGIWTDKTFDYIKPSQMLARSYLETSDRVAWSDEIDAMISEHHKIRKYELNPEWLVEPFRKADWIDISAGMLRFRLPDNFVIDVIYGIPNAGFHKKLALLALERIKAHPFSPLPMVKL
jgi:hypothetical protein